MVIMLVLCIPESSLLGQPALDHGSSREFANELGTDCGSYWHWASPFPYGNRLNAATWARDRFVAVGDYGAVLTSQDGVSWRREASGTSANLNGVAWTGKSAVAVGYSGTILTSPDGLVWTNCTSGTTSSLYAVIWTGTKLVAVGSGGHVVTSPDGLTWEVQNSGVAKALLAITWTGRRLLAVGSSGTIATSSNGVNWTSWTMEQGKSLYGVTWTGTTLVAVGVSYGIGGVSSGKIFTSPDGVVWAEQQTAGSFLRGVAWTGDQVVVVGWSGSNRPLVWSSPDGVSWSGGSAVSSDAYGGLNGISVSGPVFVAVGSGGDILISPDGNQWLAQTRGVRDDLRAAVWAGTQMIAVGSVESGPDGAANTSPNGLAWTNRVLPAEPRTVYLHDVTWTGSQIVAVGGYAAVLTSADGVEWVRRSVPVPLNTGLVGVTWTGAQLIAVGYTSSTAGTILTSPTGETWVQRSAFSYLLRDVVQTDSGAIAVGNDGAIHTSLDGISWTNRTLATNKDLHGVTWTGKQAVAVGESGTILTSPNGDVWTAQTSGTPETLYGVTWNGESVIAVGSAGTVLISPDGTTWASRGPVSETDLFGVAWTGSGLVAVGAFGTILQSYCDDSCTPPSVTSQPRTVSAPVGQVSSLRVSVAGSEPVSFQWYVGSKGDTSNPVGEDSPSLNPVGLAEVTTYWVRVSNACGYDDSAIAGVIPSGRLSRRLR